MNQHRIRIWSEADTALLKQMWWDGDRPETIGYALKGRSPRAISDKANNEGFKRNPELRLRSGPSLFELPEFMLPVMRAGGELITMINVRHKECRWIESNEPTPEAPMCGRGTGGGPWCAFHVKRVFTKTMVPVSAWVP